MFQTIECSLLKINQSSEQLASGDHVTTEQSHAVSRVTRDTWPVFSVTPTQCLYCAQIFTLLHKDTIYQLLAGLGWAGLGWAGLGSYKIHRTLCSQSSLCWCPPSAQPRHTVCIGTLPLTGDQAAVAVTPSPRHSLSTRYLEAERPVSTLCGAGAPLRTSQ